MLKIIGWRSDSPACLLTVLVSAAKVMLFAANGRLNSLTVHRHFLFHPDTLGLVGFAFCLAIYRKT